MDAAGTLTRGGERANETLRVLVCDDSPTYAAALRRLLESGSEIEVVAVHGSAESAIAALPDVRPDLVTMDVELPGMSGLDAVEQIMSTYPVPILVLSSRTRPGNETAARAFAAGAADALSKDDLDLGEPSSAFAAAFRRRVRLVAAMASSPAFVPRSI